MIAKNLILVLQEELVELGEMLWLEGLEEVYYLERKGLRLRLILALGQVYK